MRSLIACVAKVAGVFGLAVLGGCGAYFAAPAAVPEGPLATSVDAAEATPEFWLDKPVVAQAQGGDFDAMMAAAVKLSRDYRFEIDQADYRSGVILTKPSTTAQWFEPWRYDAGTAGGLGRASLSTYRRTLRWEVVRDGGGVVAAPRVLIERYAVQGRRISTVLDYQSSMAALSDNGARTEDDGRPIDVYYWYATGRDFWLEQTLAEKLTQRLADAK